MVLATGLYEVILAVHIMAVVVAFGVTFAFPLMFIAAARAYPSSLPALHRVEYMVARMLINPAMVVILAAGIYLASKGHFWSQFFVQWGLAAVIVIGAGVGALLIPASKKAEALAKSDLGAGGTPSAEYRSVVQRINLVGSALSLIVLLTILFMVIKP